MFTVNDPDYKLEFITKQELVTHYTKLCDGHPETMGFKIIEVFFECPTCESKGFEPSILEDQCTFCDGTESGVVPSYPCSGCGKDTLIECGLSEFDPKVHYCGGNPWCCP